MASLCRFRETRRSRRSNGIWSETTGIHGSSRMMRHANPLTTRFTDARCSVRPIVKPRVVPSGDRVVTVAFMNVVWQFGLSLLLLASSASPLSGSTQKSPSTHRITFTFDYDFRLTPACSPEVTQGCVQQFNLYEISPGILNRVKLGSIPVPVGATGYAKGISVTTKPFLFVPGEHRLAVSAQMPNGQESDLRVCTTIVKIR